MWSIIPYSVQALSTGTAGNQGVNIHLDGRCILCGDRSLEPIDQIHWMDLRRLYRQQFSIDIAQIAPQLDRDAVLVSYRCQACGVEFDSPCVEGDAGFYEQLCRTGHYVFSNAKWEFDQAIRDIGDGQRVMDVGCAEGAFLAQLCRLRRGIQPFGVEPCARARERCQERGLVVTGEPMGCVTVTYAEAFDVVCGFQVLEHVASPATLLGQMVRCLRPGGRLLLSVPNMDGFIRCAVNDLLNLPPHHVSRWRPSTMEAIARRAGLRVLRLLCEPVADYHREWYRQTMIIQGLAKLFRRSLARAEPGASYVWMRRCARVVDLVWPKTWWSYTRHHGHTFYVCLEKP